MRHMLLSQARSLTRTQVCVFVVPVSAEEPSEGCVREETSWAEGESVLGTAGASSILLMFPKCL